jgi:uncharacterized protein DUF6471
MTNVSDMMIFVGTSEEHHMPDKDKWVTLSQTILKAELKRKGIGYRELAERLTAMGTPETDRNIANKVSRGGFTAAFFLQCLSAIGVSTLHLES